MAEKISITRLTTYFLSSVTLQIQSTFEATTGVEICGIVLYDLKNYIDTSNLVYPLVDVNARSAVLPRSFKRHITSCVNSLWSLYTLGT